MRCEPFLGVLRSPGVIAGFVERDAVLRAVRARNEAKTEDKTEQDTAHEDSCEHDTSTVAVFARLVTPQALQGGNGASSKRICCSACAALVVDAAVEAGVAIGGSRAV
jgi:hypothetical protein